MPRSLQLSCPVAARRGAPGRAILGRLPGPYDAALAHSLGKRDAGCSVMGRVALLCALLAVSGGAEVRRRPACRLLHGRPARRVPRASSRLAAGCSDAAACGLAVRAPRCAVR